jgi:DnaA family protein
MTSPNSQLVLNVRLRSEATFPTYYIGPNAEAVGSLSAMARCSTRSRAEQGQLYLWGAPATGKSHLLQALCHEFSRRDMSVVYLPLKMLEKEDAALLNDLGGLDLVCVDDVDVVLNRFKWEMALFNLINVLRQTGNTLVLASQQNPSYMKPGLLDLKSRLVWGPVFKLQSLDDEGKLRVLQAHANQRGINLSDEVGRYILNNFPRDLVSLLQVLDRLDESSLAAKRRLTIPFIKSVSTG